VPLFFTIWFYYQPFGMDAKTWADDSPVKVLLQGCCIWVYTLSSTILLLLTKWIVIFKYRPGTYSKTSWYYQRWHLVQNAISTWESTSAWTFRGTPLLNCVYKLLGANVALSARLDEYISDFDLVEIGPNTVLRGALTAHLHSSKPQRVMLAHTRIANNCYVGGNSMIEPGANLGSCSYVHNMSVIPQGLQLPGRMQWHGNPVRPCGTSSAMSKDNGASWVKLLPAFVIPYGAICFTLYLLSKFTDLISDGGDIKAAGWLLAFILSVVVVCFCCLLGSVIIKWVAFGKAQPGAVVTEDIKHKVVHDFVLRLKTVADMVLNAVYQHTPLINVLLYLYGGKMAISAHAASLNFDPLEADLIDVAANVEISAMRMQCSEVRYDGAQMTKHLGVITVGRNAELGFHVVIESGTTIEEGASVGFITRVPTGTVVRKNTVLYGNPGVTMKKRNMEQRDTIISLSLSDWFMRNIFNVTFRVLVLAAIVVGAGTGSWYLCNLALPDISDWIHGLGGEQRSGYRDIEALYVTVSFVMLLFAFLVGAVLATIIFKWLVMGCMRATSVQRYDLFVQLYHSYTIVTATFNGTILRPASGTWVVRLIYKLYGANVKLFSRTVIWGSTLDQDLVTIGDDVVISEGAALCGHNYEHAGLKFMPTTVADGCTLLPGALLMAGDSMHENSVLGSKAKPFGANDPCEPDTLNVGCPARWATFVDNIYDSTYHNIIADSSEGFYVDDSTSAPRRSSDSMEQSLLAAAAVKSDSGRNYALLQ